LKRAIIGIVSFLAIAAIGLFLYLSLTDFSEYRSEIEEAVTEATGREFRIGGDFTLDAVPPVFIAEDVTWANADWAADEPMLYVGHVTLRIDGSSLLFEPLVIEEFLLRDVRVIVEENEEGTSNWYFEPDPVDDIVDAQIEVQADDGRSVLLQHAELENVTMIRRSPGTDDQEFTITRLDVETSEEGYLVAQGGGRIDEQEMTLQANVGPLDNLASGKNVDIALAADFGFLAATANGNTGDIETLEGTTLEARVSSDDIATAINLFDVPLNARGPLKAEAAVRAVDGAPFIKFDAELEGLDAGGSVLVNEDRMTVEASVSSLPAAGAIADVDGLPPGPASVKGDVLWDGNQLGLFDFVIETTAATATTTLNAVIDGDRISLDPFSLESGESDLSGTLSVHTADPIEVTGNLRSSRLDLTPFTGGDEAEAAAPAETGTAKSRLVLSEDPLPFDFLNAGNVDVTLLIEELRNGPMQLKQVEGRVKLADGTLTAEGGLDVAAGGEADANITLVSLGESAEFDVDFKLSGFRPNQQGTDERPVEDIPLLGLSADIESSGNSIHAIAAASNGKVILTQGAGKVDNRAMGFFSADIVTELFSALNPFAEKEPYSNWECTVLGMDIVDGVATINPMLAQSEKITIVADGTVDFNDERLNISFNTKPRKGVGVSADMFLTPFIQLGGTMASPRLALDKKGVLIEGGAAFLTGGVSFFVKGAADRATGGADRCAAALAIARGEDVETEPSEDQ
jgi:uncharacterized protein involved in outer membrane biogenesis